jgi:hypothetical protein
MKYMKTKITAIVVIILFLSAGYYYFVSSNKVSNNAPVIPVEQKQTTPLGKININEVCEGALIRMTFENGEAAAKFVEECKEGKHPEVIEQFKAEMNLGAGAEI